MTKLRMVLAAVVFAMGCTPPPQKVAAPKGACFCKSSSCLCAHCSTGKGDCNCKR